MPADEEIRAALERRADELDRPPPSLSSIHRDAVGRPRSRRGLLVAAAVLVLVAVAGALAWRDRTDSSSVITGGPDQETPATPDPASFAYIPSFVSNLAADVSDELDLTRTEDGYRLLATTTTGSYRFAFERNRRSTGGRFGTSEAFTSGIVEQTPTTIGWSDAVGTVSVTGTGSGADRAQLEQVAQSLILVDLDTYERFLEDPTAPVDSRPIALVFGRLDVGTVRWNGELTSDGILLRTTGKATGGGSASIGVTSPAELGSWKAGAGGYQLLRVPADFASIEVSRGQAEIVGTVTDPSVGPIVLLHADALEPVEYSIDYTGDRPSQPYSLCIEVCS